MNYIEFGFAVGIPAFLLGCAAMYGLLRLSLGEPGPHGKRTSGYADIQN